jgi:hypothetical protein
VVAQWDRLSRHWCYMMILAGPAKVDLIFGRPHFTYQLAHNAQLQQLRPPNLS